MYKLNKSIVGLEDVLREMSEKDVIEYCGVQAEQLVRMDLVNTDLKREY